MAEAKENKSILSQLIAEANINETDKALTEQGIGAVLDKVISDGLGDEKISTKLIDHMMAEIDKKVSAQIDEVLHNEQFQQLEATWRGVEFLRKRTDFSKNIDVVLLHATRDELQADFDDAPSIQESGVYKHVYTAEYGQFGGKPYTAMIGDYHFGPSTRDISLLKDLAAVGEMAFCPFISAAAPSFFNCKDWSGLPNLKDLDAIFGMPQTAAWNSFRETADARNVALVLPHFLGRVPYNQDTAPVNSFNYEETVTENGHFLWTNSAYAFASRLTDSFAKYGWCANIVGPKAGGKVDNLPMYSYEALGQTETKIPTDILISERREYELSELGFTALTLRKNGDDAVFFAANSAQKPRIFPDNPEGKTAEMNFRLGTQLPYNFIISRLAHYLKVIQYENLGSWTTATQIQTQLNDWISQYVVNMAEPGETVKSRKPLRAAEVIVEDVPGENGWYKCSLTVSPHFKYMGANISLSLVGTLDKAS